MRLRPVAKAEARATEDNGLTWLFEREQRRAAGQATLAAAVLTSGGGRYLLRRALPPFARVPLRTALHVAEVIVLADFVELGILGWLLAIRSATVLFGAFHWGALEPFRQSMRRHAAQGQKGDAEAEVARYLRLSLDLCLLILVALVGITELGPRPFPTFSILDAYAIGCAVRAMSETVTRTLHSGAFALRRVRRPLFSFVLQDAVDAGVPLLLWPWLGPWGFALGQLVGTAVEAALTLRYVRRTYVDLGLTIPSFRRIVGSRTRVPFVLVRQMLAPGLGNLLSQVDAVLVTALVASAGAELFGLVALVHVLRPVLTLSSSWSRSFYFDLARLEGPIQALFRARLERVLLRAIPWFVLVSAACSLAVGVLLTRTAPVPAVLWVLPFLAARAFYAVAQLRAFVWGAYGRLLVGALVVALGVLLLPRLSEGMTGAVLVATAVLGGAGVVLFGRGGNGSAWAAEQETSLLRPFAFLARAGRLAEDREVTLVTLNEAGGVHVPGVLRALAASSGVEHAARLDRWLIALVASHCALGRRALVEASGGAAVRIERLVPDRAGRATLAERCRVDDRASRVDETRLRAEFARRFPGGSVLDRTSGSVPSGMATARELGFTLAELGVRASGVRPSRRRGVRACVYAPGAEASVVFVPPRDADATTFATFQRLVTNASIRATLRL